MTENQVRQDMRNNQPTQGTYSGKANINRARWAARALVRLRIRWHPSRCRELRAPPQKSATQVGGEAIFAPQRRADTPRMHCQDGQGPSVRLGRGNPLVLIAASNASLPVVYDFSGSVSGALVESPATHRRDPPDLLDSVTASPWKQGVHSAEGSTQ